MPPRARLPLLALGFVGLALGTLAGLARFGWSMPPPVNALAGAHGPLLLAGFFGTVIGLERAVALGRRWAYAAPLFAGIATLAIGIHRPFAASAAAVASSLVLVGASVVIQYRQPLLFTATLTAASLCFAVGAIAWAAGAPPAAAAPWWFAFLVLTIAAERLELSRFMPPSRLATRAFVAVVALLIAGVALAELRVGRAMLGLALIGLAAWLFRNDIARRTVRQPGLPRYIAVCLLAGYGWLAVAGVWVALGDAIAPGTPGRDAALHALGLGFVMSMVFGHAPIIVPAVVRARIRWGAIFYAPLALLHASLLLRIAGGALDPGMARAGALGNALALLLFIATVLRAALPERRAGGSPG